jgi:hypothetical protein
MKGLEYALLPDGEIEMKFPDGTIRTNLDSARYGLSVMLNGNPLNTLKSVWRRYGEDFEEE